MKKFYLILITLVLKLPIFGIELNPQESFVLEKFFRIMLEKSEGGYVLDGVKPVCINGFCIEDFFTGENETHCTRICLKEGSQLLKKLNIDSKKSGNIIIHVYDKEDSLAKNNKHILFINKALFLETVQSNLPLFQYVLGSQITPISLLNKLTDPKETFHSVLKEDKVLIGILLGFGVQNALHVSRVENLQEALFAAEHPPLQSRITQLGEMQKEFKEMLLYRSSAVESHKDLTTLNPSFGFYSLRDEIKELCQKLDVSSNQLVKNSPRFIFGRLKEDLESNQLIQKLEQSQTTIVQLLNSDSFLEKVLQMIYPQEKIVACPYLAEHKQFVFNQSEIQHLPYLIAKNIWVSLLEDEPQEYREAFIKGMIDAEKGVEELKAASNTLQYSRFKALAKIKSNIEAADQFFNHLEKDPNYHQSGSAQVYYKVIQEANGPSLDNQTQVVMHYSIKAPDDQVLADTWISGKPAHVDLLKTIPGFAWGLKGIKVGEIREIYIHPSYAYGIYTTLEKGIYLKANVQLLDIKSSLQETFLEPAALQLIEDKNIDSKYKEMAKEVGYANGYKVWDHYKKGQYYTFDQILDLLRQIQQSLDVNISSESDQNLLNHLHWNIYHL